MIDWVTVAAQIVNFLILVALLKHFLYGPLIQAMDRREQSIRDRLNEADRKVEQADRNIADFEQKEQALKDQREERLKEARDEADKERKRRISEARDEVEQMKRKWQEALRREQDALHDELRRTVGQQSVAVARHALSDMADARLESQVVRIFLRQLSTLKDEEKQTFQEALQNGDAEAAVQTAFELNEDEQSELEQGLSKHLSADAAWNIQVSEKLICGIELSAGGRKMAWTLDRYLEDANTTIEKLVRQAARERESDDDAENDRS